MRSSIRASSLFGECPEQCSLLRDQNYEHFLTYVIKKVLLLEFPNIFHKDFVVIGIVLFLWSITAKFVGKCSLSMPMLNFKCFTYCIGRGSNTQSVKGSITLRFGLEPVTMGRCCIAALEDLFGTFGLLSFSGVAFVSAVISNLTRENFMRTEKPHAIDKFSSNLLVCHL